MMEEFACSPLMQSFYGDMGTWFAFCALFLAAAIYREIIFLSTRERRKNKWV